MSFFIVTRQQYEEGDLEDTNVFKVIFRTQQAAIQAVEADARQTYEFLVDPNDGDTHAFPGVTEVSPNVFEFDRNDGNGIVYTLVEVEVER